MYTVYTPVLTSYHTYTTTFSRRRLFSVCPQPVIRELIESSSSSHFTASSHPGQSFRRCSRCRLRESTLICVPLL